MKGIEEAVAAEACPPFSADDTRESVPDLLAKHEKEIAQVREKLEEDPLYDASKHDDLWILRFVLSHKKKVKAAVKAAKHTLEFRKKHSLDDKDIRFDPVGGEALHIPAVKAFMEYCDDDAFVFIIPPSQRCIVGFVKYCGVDSKGLVDNLDESLWLPVFLSFSEWCFQWTDYMTRTSGRLTKLVRLVDLKDFSIAKISRECGKRDSHAMAQMEDCYPQLLKAIFSREAPKWIHSIWKIFRQFIPKRVLNKFDFLNPTSSERDRKRLLELIEADVLPTMFGGDNLDWPPKCPLSGKK